MGSFRSSIVIKMSSSQEPSLKKEEITQTQAETQLDSEDEYLQLRAEQRVNRTKHRSWSDIITIVCSGFALISDGYQNNVMTMLNKVFPTLYPKIYDSELSTRLSNASLVGTIFGQIGMGICCDYMGRKWAIVTGTMFLIIGTILCAAAHGNTVEGS
ncbi:unnamed protein product [Ambrosiozyma monospora]|uniref:Unnamed protein product n=1 Tax=Ambrosiozyma monospora TaxID=43982 RepID=A0ACB5TTC7_AMBMO|nr:unnamed protein product [Ambrosiozyma monospora]